MKRIVGYIAAIIAAIHFGVSIALLDPYEHTYDLIIWAFSSLLFGVIFWRMSAANRLAWILYGLATFACRLLAEFLFWNHMYKGWWYPPHYRIFSTDGAASYDVHISEVFLIFWLFLTTAFIARLLMGRVKAAT